jgi:ActR/RegA family two-component response regulator
MRADTRGALPKAIETVLLVDDDALVLRALAGLLERAGKRVVSTSDVGHARALSRKTRPQLAIIDLLLGPTGAQSGLALVQELRCDDEQLVILAYSGAATVDLMTFANEAGADVALRKDFTVLRHVLDRLESGACPEAHSSMTVARLDEVERTYIESVVHAFGGIRAASRKLRMHRSTLQRKLKKITTSGGGPMDAD